METLRDTLLQCRKKRTAIAHFNISDSNQLRAIARAARETGLPVAIGLSEGERTSLPLAHARLLIDAYRKEGLALYLNADHTYSLEKAREAIDADVDSIVVDGAKLSFDENAALVRAVKRYARKTRRFFHSHPEVLVEGELGYIGTSSVVMSALPEGAAVSEAMMTKPEDLQRFIEESGVDLAAPAVGNIHGIVTTGQPKLSIERITALAEISRVPLVLHGGSGSTDEEFVAAIRAGITMIHINTDIRLVYHDMLKKTLEESEEVAPYKFLAPAMEATQHYVAQKMRLFAQS